MMQRASLLLASGLFLLSCKNDYNVIGEPPDVDPAEITECGFTPIPGTRISRYDCNPVFSGTDEQWGNGYFRSVGFRAQEVLGHPFYQMWYTAVPEDEGSHNYGLGYAVSADGVNWEPHEDNPLLLEGTDGGWDRDGMDGLQVFWDEDDEEYVLAYQGLNYDENLTAMGIYTSGDGVDWEYYPGNPVFDYTETYEGLTFCWPLAFGKFDGEYRGFMAGGPPATGLNSNCDIYTFEGDDFDTFERNVSGSAILEGDENNTVSGGKPPNYDARGVASATIVEYDDTLYMFYAGIERWTDSGGGWITATNVNLAMATSDDGVIWNKDEANPIPVFESQQGLITNVYGQRVGKRIHLWITDYYEDLDDMAVGYFLFEPELEEPHE